MIFIPADYIAVRDSCYSKERKKNGGKLTKKSKDKCKRMAAIWYWKKHGEPVRDKSNSVFIQVDLDDLSAQERINLKYVKDGKLLIPVTQDELELVDAKAGIAEGRAVNLQVTDLKLGDSIESIGLASAEAAECQKQLNKEIARIINEEKENKNLTLKQDDTIPEEELRAIDLMYMSFKLVHAETNKNKDQFLDEELQLATNTPVLKPLNWRHGEPNIGVIYLSRYVPKTEAESSYLLCAAVQYKWKYPEIAQEIINRYNNESLFYSMETWFKRFECSECHSVYEWDDWEICKHLRDRFSEGSRVSRILHDLTFAGAAVVEKPADVLAENISIANTEVKKPKTSEANEKGVSNKMDKLELTPEELQIKIDEAIQPLKEQIASTEAKLSELSSENESLKNMIAEKDLKITESESSLNEKATALETIQNEFASFKSEIENNKKLDIRLAKLVESGVVIEDSAEFKDKIKNQSDDDFNFMLSVLGNKKTVENASADDKVSESENTSDNDGPEIPITASANSTNLDSHISDFRKQLQDLFDRK